MLQVGNDCAMIPSYHNAVSTLGPPRDDKGPNTGGMDVHTPVPIVTDTEREGRKTTLIHLKSSYDKPPFEQQLVHEVFTVVCVIKGCPIGDEQLVDSVRQPGTTHVVVVA